MSDVVVLGGGLAGLWAAAAAAGAGAQVLVLERDEPPDGLGPRPGVPQGTQLHVLLHRGLRTGEQLLPGLRNDLLAAGAVRLDTGLLPWHGEHGWVRPEPTYELLSMTRPLLEEVVRRRVLDLPQVELRWGARVDGLARKGPRWAVACADAPSASATLVVDATGRSSRLPHWLADLGVVVPEPWVVDARLGYAAQLVQGGPDPADLPGVVVQATPESPVGAVALPVEAGRWLVGAVGFGEHRPPRDPSAFAAFLDALLDPAPAALLRSGEPVGEVTVHRQTANRRHRYAEVAAWPAGLLPLGDALCCFDPVYGQGITVSALQALRLRSHLRAATGATPLTGSGTSSSAALGGERTRQVLRDFHRAADFPWAVAIGQDLGMPSCSGRRSVAQAAVSNWASAVALRAAQGDRRANRVLMGVYHLESSPSALLHPALAASVVLGRLRRHHPPSPRPRSLDTVAARPHTAPPSRPA